MKKLLIAAAAVALMATACAWLDSYKRWFEDERQTIERCKNECVERPTPEESWKCFKECMGK